MATSAREPGEHSGGETWSGLGAAPKRRDELPSDQAAAGPSSR